jgi:hypothetical protein
MAKIAKDLEAGNLHPRENLWATGALATNGAEVITPCDGCGSFMLDLRGTYSLTIELSGTVDGTNWILIPVMPIAQAGKAYLASIVGTTQGLWRGSCAGFRKVRARVTAYTSGSATAYLSASSVLVDQSLDGMITPLAVSNTGAASAAVTLTLPAPAAGLRIYVTYLSINRFAAALLTAAATPVIVTSTNLPGTLPFSIPAEAAAQGSIDRWREDFAYPIAAAAQATAVTFVAPVTTNVIWRLTAGYYLGQ